MSDITQHVDERIVLVDGTAVKNSTPSVGTPTQIANPTRTTWRTIVQAIVGNLVILVPLVNTALVSLQGFLQTQSDLVIPAWVYVVVNGGILATSFVIGLVARLMATPGVADFIAKRLPWLAPIKPA